MDNNQLQVSILVGELANQFSVIQHQIDDPFLVRSHGALCSVFGCNGYSKVIPASIVVHATTG